MTRSPELETKEDPSQRKITRRKVIQRALYIATGITIPSGFFVAVTAEQEAYEIKKQAKNLKLNSPAIPDNYRDTYIARKMDEGNVTMVKNRGFVLLATGLSTLAGGILLEIPPEQVSPEEI